MEINAFAAMQNQTIDAMICCTKERHIGVIHPGVDVIWTAQECQVLGSMKTMDWTIVVAAAGK